VSEPRAPHTSGWTELPASPEAPLLAGARRWVHTGRELIVVSGISPDDDGSPSWHVSLSRLGGRASDSDARFVRRSFDMVAAQEDNRAARIARHLWLPIAQTEHAS
jgi:hypothetical protein